MKNMSVVRLYSRVIFSEAEKKKSLDKVIEGMKLISDVLSESPLMFRFLGSPIYSLEEKMKFLKPLEDKFAISKLAMHFVEVIVRNNRGPYLSDIYKYMANQQVKRTGITIAKLTTANEMNSAGIKTCQSMLEKKLEKKFAIKHNIDPSIIGGVRLEFDNIMYDASVLSAFEKIESSLV